MLWICKPCLLITFDDVSHGSPLDTGWRFSFGICFCSIATAIAGSTVGGPDSSCCLFGRISDLWVGSPALVQLGRPVRSVTNWTLLGPGMMKALLWSLQSVFLVSKPYSVGYSCPWNDGLISFSWSEPRFNNAFRFESHSTWLLVEGIHKLSRLNRTCHTGRSPRKAAKLACRWSSWSSGPWAPFSLDGRLGDLCRSNQLVPSWMTTPWFVFAWFNVCRIKGWIGSRLPVRISSENWFQAWLMSLSDGKITTIKEWSIKKAL